MNNYTGESEGAENTLELREGVANLRKCSFRPEHYFVRIPGFHDGDEESYYLEVKWREFWFHCYCDENNIQDRAIEELPVTLIAGTSFLQAESHVTMNGKIVGRGVGGYCISGNDMNYAVQIASTIAKGRALANAGFGSVFTSASESESGGIEIPCDSGVSADFFVFQPQKLDPSYGNPMQVPAPPPLQSDAPAMPANPRCDNQPFIPQPQTAPEPPARQATQTPVSAQCPRTREEALSFPVPLRGTWYGKPLSEVIAKDPASVRYYAERSRNGDLKQAARLILSMT